MISIRNRWLAFIHSMAERMDQTDAESAKTFLKIQGKSIPPDEKSLEWGMAYIKAQQAMMELLGVYRKHERHVEAYIITTFMIELNRELERQKDTFVIPKEFVKTVDF